MAHAAGKLRAYCTYGKQYKAAAGVSVASNKQFKVPCIAAKYGWYDAACACYKYAGNGDVVEWVGSDTPLMLFVGGDATTGTQVPHACMLILAICAALPCRCAFEQR